jgi:hypothetical protein|tara:strand:+ start:1820 stop:2023 length:204 start_codon:yes stop_codon:yes gene_type:complete
MDLKIESVELTFASNGVIVDYRGQNANNDYCSRKEVFPTWITASERAQIVWQSRFDGSVFHDSDIDQ